MPDNQYPNAVGIDIAKKNGVREAVDNAASNLLLDDRELQRIPGYPGDRRINFGAELRIQTGSRSHRTTHPRLHLLQWKDGTQPSFSRAAGPPAKFFVAQGSDLPGLDLGVTLASHRNSASVRIGIGEPSGNFLQALPSQQRQTLPLSRR